MTNRFPLQAVLLVLLVLPAINAQETSQKIIDGPPATATAAAPAKKSKPTSAAAKAKIEQQKALGLTLLVSLANEARNFSDQTLRARTLSRIADALWEPDPDQGRALFRKAWDAAEVADQDAARRTEEERQRQQAGDTTRPFALVQPFDLRAEVLRLAAKRDRALGEELLDKLKEARKQEATDAGGPPRLDPFATPATVRQRLRLANQLLETDVERALQFAEPVLGTVTMDGLNFLSSLRDKNAAAADQRYLRMLAIAETDLKSDANTVSLLSSFPFTPHLFVTFDSGGGQSSSSMTRPTPPPEVAPELRSAYLRVAAQILLRPMPNREQDRSSSGVQGKYQVIKRLLPVFEQYASKEITDQLRVEMAVLKQGIPGNVSESDDENPIQRGITPERKPEDVEKSLLDRIERAKTSEERDALYLQLASRTAQRGDMRARDFAEKIEDSELRKQARPFVDMYLARNAVEKRDTEKALTLAAKGDLTHLQRAWLLTQVAKALPPAEREKAMESIAEAAAEARRIDVSDADRPRALVAVANALWLMDHARAWETILEVIKAANSAEGFNGEDGGLMWRLQSKNMTSLHSSSVDDFNLLGIFRSLSQENASQAIELARSFEGEAPRATALIAVSRTLLGDKK
ncbi:MAG: hypothetical protein QOF62_3295 [Pyrinomonadaceae bacterium]|jgi:hypothetical protein|nr:hypothetical protein [Pyrinomonadaceae bacterium]